MSNSSELINMAIAAAEREGRDALVVDLLRVKHSEARREWSQSVDSFVVEVLRNAAA